MFIQAYLGNGQNATQAAITAGFSERTAYSQGQRLLKNVEVRQQLQTAARQLAEVVGLSTERTLREVARIAYADPRRLFRPDGTMLTIHELDPDIAAAVASIEVGEAGKTKISFWPKVEALTTAMRHLGLFEKDNRHKQENLAIQINLVDSSKR